MIMDETVVDTEKREVVGEAEVDLQSVLTVKLIVIEDKDWKEIGAEKETKAEVEAEKSTRKQVTLIPFTADWSQLLEPHVDKTTHLLALYGEMWVQKKSMR